MYKLHIRILAKELELPRGIVALFNYILLLLMLTLTKGRNKKKQNAKILCQVSLEKKAKRVSKSECFFCAIMYREVCHRIVLYFYNAFRGKAYRMHWIQCALLIPKCDIIVNALKLVIKLYIFYEEEKRLAMIGGIKLKKKVSILLNRAPLNVIGKMYSPIEWFIGTLLQLVSHERCAWHRVIIYLLYTKV